MVLAEHYEIDLRLAPQENDSPDYGGDIAVDCRLTVRNAGDEPVEHLSFLLYRLLELDGVWNDDGEPLPIAQRVVGMDDAPRLQALQVQVTLPAPLPSRATTCLRLCYGGPICGYTEVWPYVHDRVGYDYTLLRLDVLWYPVPIRGLADINRLLANPFDYEVRVQSPYGLVAVTGGEMVGRCTIRQGSRQAVRQGSRQAVTWRSCLPNWRIDVAAAPFCELSAQDAGGHFAVYALSEDEAAATLVLDAMRHTAQLCADWFLPLDPPRSLTIVEIPAGWGGQVSPSLILQPAEAFDLDAGRPLADLYVTSLFRVAHEVAHLWNAASGEEVTSRWLDEGFAHYVETLVLRQIAGHEAYEARLAALRGYFMRGGDLALTTPLLYGGQFPDVTQHLARGKGPWVLAVLHVLLGDDDFFAVVREFLRRHAPWTTRPATLPDFARVAQEVSGRDLTAFFDDWFYGTASSQLLAQSLSLAEIAACYAG